MDLLKSLNGAPRLLAEVSLRPIQGSRFQPTGFPDIGPATYQGFNEDGEKESMLLVESAQSMANRLEAVIWDEATQDLIPELQGLPYVRILDEDRQFLSCSILEAHRLNSARIEKATLRDGTSFHEEIASGMGFQKKGKGYDNGGCPIDMGKVYKTSLKFDPNSLIHGIFLESIAGRIRFPRVLTAFVEASQVERAASGGVKFDHLAPEKSEGQTAKEGFGNVPFHRDEFSGIVTGYFNLDLAQIRGFRLPHEAQELIVALALLKMRLLLDNGFRLRTACDFDASEIKITRPDAGGFSIPKTGDLLSAMPDLIKKCKGHFADPAVTEVIFKG